MCNSQARTRVCLTSLCILTYNCIFPTAEWQGHSCNKYLTPLTVACQFLYTVSHDYLSVVFSSENCSYLVSIVLHKCFGYSVFCVNRFIIITSIPIVQVICVLIGYPLVPLAKIYPLSISLRNYWFVFCKKGFRLFIHWNGHHIVSITKLKSQNGRLAIGNMWRQYQVSIY